MPHNGGQGRAAGANPRMRQFRPTTSHSRAGGMQHAPHSAHREAHAARTNVHSAPVSASRERDGHGHGGEAGGARGHALAERHAGRPQTGSAYRAKTRGVGAGGVLWNGYMSSRTSKPDEHGAGRAGTHGHAGAHHGGGRHHSGSLAASVMKQIGHHDKAAAAGAGHSSTSRPSSRASGRPASRGEMHHAQWASPRAHQHARDEPASHGFTRKASAGVRDVADRGAHAPSSSRPTTSSVSSSRGASRESKREAHGVGGHGTPRSVLERAQSRGDGRKDGRAGGLAAGRPASGSKGHNGLVAPIDTMPPGIPPCGQGDLPGYSIGRVIGEGGFCQVRLGIHHFTRCKVAVKMIDKTRLVETADKRRIGREIRVLKRLSHSNVIRIFDVLESHSKIYVVMEYCEGGSLLDYVRSKKRLTEAKACTFLQQVLRGLEHCHHQGVVHRDIKLENLLLDADRGMKIIDFGLSAILQPGRKLRVHCGSPSYAAPEIVARKLYEGPPVDIWSLGVVLFAMVSGYLPFHAQQNNKQELCHKIIKGTYNAPDYISKESKDLLRKMLTVDPSKRISIQQIWKHPWMRSFPLCASPKAGPTTVALDPETGETDEDSDIVDEMEIHGFHRSYTIEYLIKGEANYATSTYYLMAATKAKFARQAEEESTSAAPKSAFKEPFNRSKGAASPRAKGAAGGARPQTPQKPASPGYKDLLRPGSAPPGSPRIGMERLKRQKDDSAEALHKRASKTGSRGTAAGLD